MAINMPTIRHMCGTSGCSSCVTMCDAQDAETCLVNPYSRNSMEQLTHGGTFSKGVTHAVLNTSEPQAWQSVVLWKIL